MHSDERLLVFACFQVTRTTTHTLLCAVKCLVYTGRWRI